MSDSVLNTLIRMEDYRRLLLKYLSNYHIYIKRVREFPRDEDKRDKIMYTLHRSTELQDKLKEHSLDELTLYELEDLKWCLVDFSSFLYDDKMGRFEEGTKEVARQINAVTRWLTNYVKLRKEELAKVEASIRLSWDTRMFEHNCVFCEVIDGVLTEAHEDIVIPGLEGNHRVVLSICGSHKESFNVGKMYANSPEPLDSDEVFQCGYCEKRAHYIVPLNEVDLPENDAYLQFMCVSHAAAEDVGASITLKQTHRFILDDYVQDYNDFNEDNQLTFGEDNGA